MARIRTLKPEIASDMKLASVSRDARYTFVLLITQSDDYGLIRGSHRQLLGALYPHEDDVAVDDLTGWLDELRHIQIIRDRMTIDGAPVIQLVNWSNHQRLDNVGRPTLASKLVPLADPRGKPPQTAEDRGLDLGPGTMDPGEDPHGSSGDEPSTEKAGSDTGTDYPSEFERAWELYPKRPNNPKRRAFKAWRARTRAKVSATELLEAVTRYAAYCSAKRIVGTETVMQAQTFFGPDERWMADFTAVASLSAAGPSADTDRARVFYDLCCRFALLSYTAGAKGEYRKKLELAKADPAAGPDFEAEVIRVKPWEKPIAEASAGRWAVQEIARRLTGQAPASLASPADAPSRIAL